MEHQHIYLGNCPGLGFNDNYIGETTRKVSEQFIDLNVREKKLHLVRRGNKQKHKNIKGHDFRMIGKGFKKCALKQKNLKGLF